MKTSSVRCGGKSGALSAARKSVLRRVSAAWLASSVRVNCRPGLPQWLRATGVSAAMESLVWVVARAGAAGTSALNAASLGTDSTAVKGASMGAWATPWSGPSAGPSDVSKGTAWRACCWATQSAATSAPVLTPAASNMKRGSKACRLAAMRLRSKGGCGTAAAWGFSTALRRKFKNLTGYSFGRYRTAISLFQNTF